MTVCDRMRRVEAHGAWVNVPCGSRYCPACGRTWMQDQRVQAVAASEFCVGDVGMITATAPGVDALRRMAAQRGMSWGTIVRWWNATARDRWRRLHLEASYFARQMARAEGVEWRVLYRAWEYQKRGLLHAHVVVPMGCDVQAAVSRFYVRRLVECADFYGFGFMLGGDKDESPAPKHTPRLVPVPAGQAARYVAKYLTSTGAGKDNMVSTVKRTAQRGSILYLSVTLTRQSGVTMSTLKARRRIWCRYPWARDSEAGWRAATVVDAMQRGRPAFTQEAVVKLRRAALRARPDLWVDQSTGEHGPPTRAPVPYRTNRNLVPRPDDGGWLVAELAVVSVGDCEDRWLVAREILLSKAG